MDRAQQKPPITVGKFSNIDIRVGRICDVSDPIEIADKNGKSRQFRVLRLDFAELGVKTSVGQFALVPIDELRHRHVLAVCNLSPRAIDEAGAFVSEVLTLGTRHPNSPPDQSQALPIYAHELASPNDEVY